MPKTLILYRSPHHGNTKKLLDAIVKAYPDVDLAEAGKDTYNADDYEIIGIASGVYMGKPHRSLPKALETVNGNGRKAFAVLTSGDSEGSKYGERFLALLRQQDFKPCGFYWAVGHDSFGPLRLVGGINKGRPNRDEINGAAAFYAQIISEAVK